MQYKKLGKTGDKGSILGFGAMRLPLVDEKDLSRIEEKEAAQMIQYGVENGINYFDTAWPYHGPVPEGGSSEPFLGKILHPFRDEVYIATKLPSWFIQEPKDMDTLLNKQLKRLRSETIDFYLLHALNQMYWEKLLSFDVLLKGIEEEFEGKNPQKNVEAARVTYEKTEIGET